MIDFQPLQIGLFLLPVWSLLGGALAASGEKRRISGFLGQSIFQFTHKLNDQIAASWGHIHLYTHLGATYTISWHLQQQVGVIAYPMY